MPGRHPVLPVDAIYMELMSVETIEPGTKKILC